MTALAQQTAALVRSLQAGLRGVVITTDEEARALVLLEDAGRALGWPVHTWSAAAGCDGDARRRSLAELLATLRGGPDDALWVLFDAGAALDAVTARALREAAQRTSGVAVVLVEPEHAAAVHARLPELTRIHLEPPDEDELVARLDEVAGLLEHGGWPGARAQLQPRRRALARAALGLPAATFERLLAEAVLAHGLSTDAWLEYVAAHKPDAVAHAGLLEHTQARPRSAVGGLETLLQWLQRRRATFEQEAAAWGVTPSRGCLLVGVQGCGKSLAARVCAHELGLPLLRLEPGRLFGGTVGESEANLRRALAQVERTAPVVLWIDELDKGFAGVDGADSDAGTSARVLGGLLTWLQERSRPVFVVATANRVELLPAELLRRGRFDEIFFVDLPGPDERVAIVRVHLLGGPESARPGGDALAEFDAIARAAEGHSGAELEAAVAEARLSAFVQRRRVQPSDLQQAIAATIPLSVLRAEEIGALRRWAAGRARRA
ncbi:MAG: AAA family ATPase [Nannocystaceae bacterium]|nr:AAA family ATPase [Nannocystaceae bacterium]